MLFLLFLLVSAHPSLSNKAKSDPGAHNFFYRQTSDSISGVWAGSSLCGVKPSPCHDENAVYHITRLSAGSFSIQMNKMVEGKKVEMGSLRFGYDAKRLTLVCRMQDRQGREGIWQFAVQGTTTNGR